MSYYNSLSICKLAQKFDNFIDSGQEYKIISVIDNLNKKTIINKNELIEINNIFFIWIGSIKSNALEYISIWHHCYKNKYNITLYIDGNFLLFNQLNKIFNLFYNINETTPNDDIIFYQNDFNSKLKKGIDEKNTFDELLIKYGKRLGVDLTIQKKLAHLKLSIIKKHIKVVDIRNIDNVFYSRFFEEMYSQELTLRHNAACASDLLRLNLLYCKGGMYVDVDTLPCHSNVFNKVTPLSHSVNDNILNIIKTEYILRTFRHKQNVFKKNISVKYLERMVNNKKYLKKLKKSAREKIDIYKIQDGIFVKKSLLKIASPSKYYEVNNNVLISNKGAKTIRIILRAIKLRYLYLLKNNLIYSTSSNKVKNSSYLNRLNTYRYDSFQCDKSKDVTLFLTGPCLIHEVLIGLCYEIYKLPKNISPLSVSYLFRLNQVFLSFEKQVNYTPEHMRSSWM